MLRSATLSLPEITPHPDVGRRLSEIEEALGRSLAQLDTEIRVKKETEQELRSFNARAIELERAMREGEASSAQKSQQQRRWAALLQGVLDHLSGEVCPVCGRDYSELKSGELKSRITQELRRLGLDNERLESAARRRSQLETERDAVLRRIAAIKELTKEDQSPLGTIQVRRDQLSKMMNTFAAERGSRQDWVRVQQEEARIRTDLMAGAERLSQMDKT